MIPKTKNTITLLTRQAILVDTLERFQVTFDTEEDHTNTETLAILEAYQKVIADLGGAVFALRNAVERAH